MNTVTEHKIIKNKVGLLKLAETLNSVSQACKVMGFSPCHSTQVHWHSWPFGPRPK